MCITEAHKTLLQEYAKVTIKKWAKLIWNNPYISKNSSGYKNGVIKHSYGYDVTKTFINYMKRNITSRRMK